MRPKLIHDHWYRLTADQGRTPNAAGTAWSDPCGYTGDGERCGRPQLDHVESVGEWMDPIHWFLPRRPWPPLAAVCRTCGRNWRHSTHRYTPKWRQLNGR